MRINWTKGKEIEGEREAIIAKAKEIISSWGLKMPDGITLLLDFGLGDFLRYGLVEFWIANEEKEGYCGKFLFLFPNQTCPAHHHRQKHETFFVLKGKVSMKVNNEEKIIEEGGTLPMPQGTIHSFTAIEGPALILEVSKPCVARDSIFEDERIGVL
ncbi:D-lyxose/D-mannose family sugar isomerase [bacterium]|nr:D-lyxose/D-mannose family sugar isomerase [bacterium]